MRIVTTSSAFGPASISGFSAIDLLGGREGKVRFHLRDYDLISNEGTGLWLEGDAAKVGIEGFEISETPFASGLENWTIQSHTPFDKSAERVVAELELMQIWEDGPVFRSFAAAFKSELERNVAEKAGDHAEAIRAVDALLARGQVRGTKPDAFFNRCLEILGNPRAGRFGSPDKYPELAWDVFGALRSRSKGVDPGQWKKVFELLRKRLPEAKPPELLEMRSLIADGSLAYEFLSRDFMIQSARKYPELLDSCAGSLAGLEDWGGLIAVAEGKDIATRLEVLAYFCLDPRSDYRTRSLRTTYDDQQLQFWKSCISNHPWQSVEVMGRSLGKSDGFYMEPWLSTALANEARVFADKAAKEPWPDDNGKFQSGLRQYAKIMGFDCGPKGHKVLHIWRHLDDVRPDGETDQQNGRRREIAREARRQLLIAASRSEEPPEIK